MICSIETVPDRLIRDELLESDRWLWLPSDTDRVVFLGFMLRADDFGNLEGGLRRTFRFMQAFAQVRSEENAAAVLSHLVDADLVRPYQVEKRDFFHLPRFRQQRWYLARKCPPSPWDDPEKVLGKNARRIINQGLARNIATTSLQHNSHVEQGVGVGVGVDVGVEQKKVQRRKRATPLPPEFEISDRVRDWATEKGHTNLGERLEDFISRVKAKGYVYVDWDEAFMNAIRDDWAKLAGRQTGKGTTSAWWASEADTAAKGKELGIEARPGESLNDFRGRIRAAMERHD